MQQYPNTGSGLQKMFIAQLGIIICTVILIIPIIGAIIGGIGAIVFCVISMIGLNSVGRDIQGCKTAFMLTIVNLVISVLGSLLKAVPLLPGLLGIAGKVLSMLIVYYVCNSVSGELDKIGAGEAARNGRTAWTWNLVCYIIAIVFAVIGLIPLFGGFIEGVGTILVAIPSLVAEILYLIFLNKASHSFGA